jgi:hypothetical protein
MLVGLVLIVIGTVFFAQALGFIQGETLSVLWPLLVIVLGIVLLSHKALGHECEGKNCWCGGNVNWSGKKKK